MDLSRPYFLQVSLVVRIPGRLRVAFKAKMYHYHNRRCLSFQPWIFKTKAFQIRNAKPKAFH